jgi:signal transduction histidine kinase
MLVNPEQEGSPPTSQHTSSLAPEPVAMLRLVSTIQELSLARDIEAVMRIVRSAARALTSAEGATFVLRDGDSCVYADEDAIGPLWKGRRFPIDVCVSGWAMLNRQAAVVHDIYADARIPVDTYRPTFVRSLVMVPIRTEAPIGAIGTYWARTHRPTPADVQVLQALADSTSIAIENVQLYSELEQRVLARTRELEAANQDLEAFAYSVAHDLRTPLSHILGFSELLAEEYGPQLGSRFTNRLGQIESETRRMATLITDILRMSRMTHEERQDAPVNLSALAEAIIAELRQDDLERTVDVDIAPDITVVGDYQLLRLALENLLSNAWKYTSKRGQARIAFGAEVMASGVRCFYVRDNGVGFDMQQAGKAFGPFQRLHENSDFPGYGVGLALVQRIIHKHSGQLWTEATVNQGATFYFTLDESPA